MRAEPLLPVIRTNGPPRCTEQGRCHRPQFSSLSVMRAMLLFGWSSFEGCPTFAA
jgi:hypothetical protein